MRDPSQTSFIIFVCDLICHEYHDQEHRRREVENAEKLLEMMYSRAMIRNCDVGEAFKVCEFEIGGIRPNRTDPKVGDLREHG